MRKINYRKFFFDRYKLKKAYINYINALSSLKDLKQNNINLKNKLNTVNKTGLYLISRILFALAPYFLIILICLRLNLPILISQILALIIYIIFIFC